MKRIMDREAWKITVEEKSTGAWIATFWDKNDSMEVDRKVVEFETFGGAMDQAFTWLGFLTKEKKVAREAKFNKQHALAIFNALSDAYYETSSISTRKAYTAANKALSRLCTNVGISLRAKSFTK